MDEPLTWQYPSGIPASANCLEGHFPGNPIVPGAYLLALAEACLSDAGWRIASVRRVKFRAPLRPEEAFALSAIPTVRGVSLQWIRSGLKIAEATVTLQAR